MRALIVFVLILLSFSFSSAQDRLLNQKELQDSKWYYSLEKAFANPDSVFKLSLADQSLKTFPVEVFKLKNLQVLNLSKNKIKVLPAEIDQLKKLQVLMLTSNKIYHVPEELGELHHLEMLYFAKNKIQYLPRTLEGVNTIRKIDLTYNPLTTYEVDFWKKAYRDTNVQLQF